MSNIFYWSQNINENKNWKVKEKHLLNVNIKNQENKYKCIKLCKNKAVSVEKKVVHVHLNGNIPKKSTNRVLSSSK